MKAPGFWLGGAMTHVIKKQTNFVVFAVVVFSFTRSVNTDLFLAQSAVSLPTEHGGNRGN